MAGIYLDSTYILEKEPKKGLIEESVKESLGNFIEADMQSFDAVKLFENTFQVELNKLIDIEYERLQKRHPNWSLEEINNYIDRLSTKLKSLAYFNTINKVLNSSK